MSNFSVTIELIANQKLFKITLLKHKKNEFVQILVNIFNNSLNK